MKYKEFREYLALNKILYLEDEEKLVVFYQVEVSKIEEHSIIFLVDLVDLPYEFEMLKKAIELAETPLDEREEEKKYYLKHKFINFHTAVEYINLTTTGKVVLSGPGEDHYYKTKFSKSEIEEFKEKFDTDLRDFELIEVEE